MKNFTKGLLYLIILFVSLIPFSTNPVKALDSFSGGDGTVGNPYQIEDCTQIALVNTYLSSAFIVKNNLDCSSLGNSVMIAADGENAFEGTFNGGGFTIHLNISLLEDYVGLFRFINNATISDLRLSGAVQGAQFVGALTGLANNNSNISEVVNVANVTGTFTVGGLIGLCNYPTITNSYNAGSVTSTGHYTGGICGSIGGSGEISNSYNRGIISGTYHVGGLIGGRTNNTILVNNNFDVGKVLTNQTTFFWGGIWGVDTVSDSSVLNSGYTNNYFDVSRSTRTQCGYDNGSHAIYPITGQCESINANWTNKDYFKGNSTNPPLNSWDFVNTWETVSNGYPGLVSILSDNVEVNDEPVAPGVPWNFLNSPNASQIELYWNAPDEDGGSPITGYKIEYKLSTDTEWIEVSSSTTSYQFTDLIALTEYNFKVYAINNIGTGEAGEVTFSTIGIPDPPTNLIVEQGDSITSVNLSWTAPTYTGGADITYYLIMAKRHDDSWENYVSSVITGSTDTYFNDFFGEADYATTYDYRVQAYNGGEYSEPSLAVTYTTGDIVTNHITSCEDLQGMNDLFDDDWTKASERFVLDNDVDCTATSTWNYDFDYEVFQGFEPIEYFEGIFDGQGHTILNLYINRQDSNQVGLFAELGEATVKNLTINGANISGDEEVGIIAGYNDGYDNYFENLQIVDSEVYGDYYVGGVLGALYEGDVEIDDSEIDVYAEAFDGVGGLVGYQDYEDIYIDNTRVSGTIKGVEYVGGMVGFSYGDIEISDSVNTSSVIGVAEEDSDSYSIGGFVGYADDVDIEYSTNEGSISGSYRVGGFVGYLDDDGYFDDSSNIGSITGEYRVGGILGSGNYAYVDHCFNTGEITASFSGEDSFADFKGVGGLIGIAWNPEIEDSYNLGAVNGTGSLYVGGLLGAGSSVYIYRSFNSGVVTGSIYDHDYNGVGGLVGSSVWSNINNSYNDGLIHGRVRVGGIIGFAMEVTLYNTYNSADLTTLNAEQNGGLIGSNFLIPEMGSYSNITVENSFSTGEISSGFDVAEDGLTNGGIIGYIGYELDKSITLFNNWWNSILNNGIGFVDNGEELLPEIEGQYQKSESKEVFINNDINSPLDVWDFDEVWYTKEEEYPLLDLVIPVINLIGSDNVTVSLNSVYEDLGATAYDNIDGDITDDIDVDSYVDTSAVGTYEVYYQVWDRAGNEAKQIIRIVNVVDNGGSITPTPTPTPTPMPTQTPTPVATTTPTPTLTPNPTSTPRPTATPTPEPTETLIYILLNDFSEYLDGTGKLLEEIKVGQVINFIVDSQNHTATVKAIFNNYVIVTLASTPMDIQLNIGETKQADVNEDGIDDVRVTLNSITDGKADITFIELNQPEVTSLPETGEEIKPLLTPIPTKTPDTNNSSALILPMCIVLIVIFGIIGLVIYSKDKKGKKVKN